MEQRKTLAAIVLSSALFARALWSPSIDAQPCSHPVEARAVAGHTVAVYCEPRGADTASSGELADAALDERRAREGEAHAGSPRTLDGDSIRGPARVLFGLPIEINCAGARTLEILAGIGPARAQQIVDERERRSFERVDDLLRVRGIGPKTLAALRDAVAASPARATPDAAGAPGCRPEIARPGAESGKRMDGEHLDGDRMAGRHMNGQRI